jgi:imidazolonepropionase-like amidohydrolase
MRLVVPALIALVFAWDANAQNASSQNLAIVDATVYASPQAPAQTGVTVLIHDGKIAAVGQHVPIPSGAITLPCKGCVVLAGFWNAHIHFMEPKWDDAAHQPAETLTAQIEAMLTHSGFTTVVDTGSDGENTIALRRRIESGEIPGPRIFTSGAPIFPAHALPFYLDSISAELRSKLGQPETPADAAAFVDKNAALGTNIVKLFTGSIVKPNQITPMSVPIAKAAADEAHRHGQLVFAHSTNLDGTRVAVESGVDVLAHAMEETSGIDDPFLRAMVTRHMTMIPTLMLFSRDDNIAQIRAEVNRFHSLGGRLVYGTDTGFLPDYDQSEEFRQLAQSGLGFREILAMLTTAPAELFHAAGGKVERGMNGDLTVLSTDPASGDPAAFTKVLYTIRGGRVIFRAK